MTREELKNHCEKQMEMCEMWAISKGEKPSGKIYEEHKLILELLEQESILDKIRAEIDSALSEESLSDNRQQISDVGIGLELALSIIDKYKAESEDKE